MVKTFDVQQCRHKIGAGGQFLYRCRSSVKPAVPLRYIGNEASATSMHYDVVNNLWRSISLPLKFGKHCNDRTLMGESYLARHEPECVIGRAALLLWTSKVSNSGKILCRTFADEAGKNLATVKLIQYAIVSDFSRVSMRDIYFIIPSVCPSVRLSSAGIVSKRLHIPSNFLIVRWGHRMG